VAKIDLFARMRANPAGNWTIKDVKAACETDGMACNPPSGGGSHFKVSHPEISAILTVPSRKPIKAIYIRKVVAMIAQIRGNQK
jgi:hypothetical protein